MNCPNCKHPVKDGAIFCPYCGCKIDENQIPPNIPTGMNYNYTPPLQPTNALILEGIGLFLFLIFFVIILSSGNESTFLTVGMLFGFVLIAISHILFRRFKKKHKTLVGIGYVGYIVSSVAQILCTIYLIAVLIASIIGAFFMVSTKSTGRTTYKIPALQEKTIDEIEGNTYNLP